MEKVKVLIYGRRHDELADFARLVPQLGIEPTFVKENLDRDNAALAAGFEGVAVNALCLLNTLAEAEALAEHCSREAPELAEPGPYYVVEVLRENDLSSG